VAVGLGAYGRAGSFVQRQLSTMAKVYAQQSTWRRVKSLNGSRTGCPRNLDVPDDTCLVHGDFRIGNTHSASARVAHRRGAGLGSVDAGNPVADACYLVQPWYLPAMPQNPQGDFPSRDLARLGIPSMEEMLALYSKRQDDLRLPAPCLTSPDHLQLLPHGRHQPRCRRSRGGGTAVNRDAEVFGGMAEPTADYAWQLAAEHFGARD
jgi:hypothetical protein